MRFRKFVAYAAPAALLLCVAGCGKFFVPTSSSGGSSSTGSGDYFYIANQQADSAVAGFSVGTSALTNTSNSPYALAIAPSAIAVTPNGKYIYAATLGGIYGFSVNTNGSLTLLNSGGALVSGVNPSALTVDPSGDWLIAADISPAAYVFSINSSTGALTQQGNSLGLDAGVPSSIVVTPDNDLVYVALGTGGVDICTLTVSNGTLTKTNQLLRTLAQNDADDALAVDPAGKYLFVTETGANGLRVLSIADTGALKEISGSPFTTGLGPSAVLVDSTGSYVYVANRTDGDISAFSLNSTTGALTQLSGSPFTTGSDPSGLAEDTAHTHIGVANAGGSPDFQVFTIGTSTSAVPGGLSSFGKTTGTTASGAFAVVAAD